MATRKSSARKSTAKAATRRAPAKTAAGKGRKVAKKATVSKKTVVAKKAIPARKTVSKATASRTRANAPAAGKRASTTARKAGSSSKPRKITPAQALANTRRLLSQKHAHDREAPTWQHIGTPQAPAPEPGFQSDEARQHANALHEGEMHMHAIQGSISAQGRRSQGRRDQR